MSKRKRKCGYEEVKPMMEDDCCCCCDNNGYGGHGGSGGFGGFGDIAPIIFLLIACGAGLLNNNCSYLIILLFLLCGDSMGSLL